MDNNATAVENAVNQFYKWGDKAAHTWLMKVQTSPEAWNFVWELLNPEKPGEVQFFAASTLYTKITKQWEEVPKSDYLELRNRILEVLIYPGTSKLITSRLCQVLAAFMIKYSMTIEETREKCIVEELAGILPYNRPDTTIFLLKVLETIPKEIVTEHYVKQIKGRENILENWKITSWIIQQIFISCGTPSNEYDSNALYMLSIQSTSSWLKLGQLSLDSFEQLYPHLLNAAVRYLPNSHDEDSDPSHEFEVVQECLIMMLTHYEIHKRPQLLWEWLKSLLCVAQKHGADHFYEILTSFGETHSHPILRVLASEEHSDLENKQLSQQLIEYLLQCSEQEGRYPTEEKRSCIPYGFWYVLQDDINILEGNLEKNILIVLKPIYARLTQALLKKSELPATSEEAGSPEDRELFRCYRQDAADTLIYCYNILRDDLIILLGQRLSQQITSDSTKWMFIESTIHAFKALSDCIYPPENPYVHAFMDLMLTIPYQNYPKDLQASACSTIGEFAEWISLNPIFIERSLELVIHGLTQGPITSSAASIALKDLTRECGEQMAPLAPSILETIGRTLPNVTPGGGEGLRLMYAAGKLLNSLSSTKEQLLYLEATLGSCVVKLRELLQMPVQESGLAVVNHLKMIAIFFTTLEGAIGNTVLEALLPIFEGIISHSEWSTHDPTLEAMHNCAQKSLSSLLHPNEESKPLLKILSASYKIRPHPAAIALLKQLVLLLPNDIIEPVFAEISELTLRVIVSCRQSNSNLSELSDLLEAYFGLLAQCCKKNARLLVRVPDQVPEMLRCGIACLLLPEIGASKAASLFLTHAIIQSPHLQTYIQPIGQDLVCTIGQCIEGKVALPNIEPMTEIFLALNKTCPDWHAQWIKYAIINNANILLTQAEKENFIQAVLRERVNRRRLSEKIKEFSMLCRRATSLAL